MKKLMMALGMFVATYLLLSIDLNGKPLFAHLYNVTAPFTQGAQRSVEGLMGRSYEGTRDVGEQLFNNSVPKRGTASQGAAKVQMPKNFKAPEESLSEAEKSELNSLIKNYAK